MNQMNHDVDRGVVGRRIETKAIRVAMEMGKHILLEGPPGTSKSTLLRKIAKDLHVALYMIFTVLPVRR